MASGALAPADAGPGRVTLAALFFLQAAAMGAYTVPFANVLAVHGLAEVTSYAFCTGGIAAFISPMIVGSLADRRVPAERLLSVLCFAAAVLISLVFTAIEQGWGERAFLGLLMAYALCSAPCFTLITSIALARVKDPRKEFGPLRVWGTWGWMAAGFLVSWVLHADHSTLSGFAAAGILLIQAVYCLFLKPTPPPAASEPRRLRDFFGWEALGLLRHPDHRLIFLTSAAFSALLSTFYRYSPRHLTELGQASPAAIMSMGQILEGVAMLALASVLTRFRLKWVLLAGLGLAVVRMLLMATDSVPWIVLSICLHGPVFVLFYPTTQIYLEQRVDHRLRAQSQALLALLNSGVGNLSGYLLVNLWHRANLTATGTTDWPRFWWLIAFLSILLALVFALFYKGQKRQPENG